MNDLINMQPPSSPETEAVVLGSILRERDALLEVVGVVDENDFYIGKNKLIYKAIMKLNSKSVAVDLLTVMEEMKKDNSLELAGNAFYLTTLGNDITVSHIANIKQYIGILKDKSLQRKVIRFAYEIESKARKDIDDAVEYSRQYLFEILNSISDKKASDWISILKETMDNIYIKKQKHEQGIKTGIPSGLRSLDNYIGGWQDTDLVILGARPGVGKSSLSLFFLKSALKSGYKCLFFALEMSSEQLAQKLIGSINISPRKMKTGEISESEVDKIENYVSEIEGWDLKIDDTAGASIGHIEAVSEKEKVKNGLDIIFVDYLGLIKNNYGGTKNEEVDETSKRLKFLAKRLNIPVICAAQLNREGAKQGRIPTLTDLRDSGGIEQNADMVAFIHRDHYFTGNPETEGEGDLILAKHRGGGTGEIKFKHNKYLTNFEDAVIYSSENKVTQTELPLPPFERDGMEDETKSKPFEDDKPF